jgi:8-oxo-dGTP pyrophosphatase MutT (NUDIX family)
MPERGSLRGAQTRVDPSTGETVHPLTAFSSRLMRTAWHTRNLWHRLTRPITMGVRAIILEESTPRRVLLIRHSYIGGWHLPGGGVDRNETLVEAARREVREEVGLEIACDPQPFGVYARFRHGASDHVALFVALGWNGVPRVDGVEILESRFFALDALPGDLSPATRRRLGEFMGHAPRAEHW